MNWLGTAQPRRWRERRTELRAMNALAHESAPRGPQVGEERIASRSLSLATNGVALSAATMVRLGVGFMAWLVAARLYSSSQVGIAAAAISAMFLCIQIGNLGVDLALIALFPGFRHEPESLLDTAVTLTALTTFAVAAAFLGLAAAGLRALHVIADNPLYAGLFLLLTLLGSVWWVLDQASVALRRSDKVFVRALIAAATTLTGVAALGAAVSRTAASILASWVAAAAVACTIAFVQIARDSGGYRFRVRLVNRLTGRLLTIGLPNFALTAADNAPSLTLPIVVAETLSPRAAAFWYAVWMMSMVAYTIPTAFGRNVFAEAARTPSELSRHVREAMRIACPLAIAVTAALVALGPLVLRILGPSYAANGSGPLRILALAAAPMVIIKIYLAICRATGRLLEGTLVAAATGISAVIAGAAAAGGLGLSGIAIGWLCSQLAASVATGWRLRVQMRHPSGLVDDGGFSQPGQAPAA